MLEHSSMYSVIVDDRLSRHIDLLKVTDKYAVFIHSVRSQDHDRLFFLKSSHSELYHENEDA